MQNSIKMNIFTSRLYSIYLGSVWEVVDKPRHDNLLASRSCSKTRPLAAGRMNPPPVISGHSEAQNFPAMSNRSRMMELDMLYSTFPCYFPSIISSGIDVLLSYSIYLPTSAAQPVVMIRNDELFPPSCKDVHVHRCCHCWPSLW